MRELSMDELRAENEAKAKRTAAERANDKHGDSVEPKVDLTKAPPELSFYDKDNEKVEFYIACVVEFIQFYIRMMPYWHNKRPIKSICSTHYRDEHGLEMECPDHKDPQATHGVNYPKPQFTFLAHVYNLQAHPEVTLTDKDSGEVKKVILRKFVRRLLLPCGDADKLLKVFKNAADLAEENEKPFSETIFKVSFKRGKGEGSGWNIETVTKASVKEQLGDQLTLALPEQSLAYKSLSMRDLKKLYTKGWRNVNEEIIFGPEPGVVDPENPFASKEVAKEEVKTATKEPDVEFCSEEEIPF